jgi:hypothetical protein
MSNTMHAIFSLNFLNTVPNDPVLVTPSPFLPALFKDTLPLVDGKLLMSKLMTTSHQLLVHARREGLLNRETHNWKVEILFSTSTLGIKKEGNGG